VSTQSVKQSVRQSGSRLSNYAIKVHTELEEPRPTPAFSRSISQPINPGYYDTPRVHLRFIRKKHLGIDVQTHAVVTLRRAPQLRPKERAAGWKEGD
jgi:hypothetical protein